MKTKLVLVAVLMAALASTTYAGVYTIAPALNWSDGINPTDSGAIAIVGSFWTTEWQNFEKYNIPVYAGEVITSVVANVSVSSSSNGALNTGVYLNMRNSSWDTGTNKPHYGDAVIAGTELVNRVASGDGTGEPDLSMIVTDITSYFSQPGIGQGNPLSIRYDRKYTTGLPYSNIRGASLGSDWDNRYNGVTLTITTAPIPEPATIVLLGLGGIASLIRRRK